jgi:hypothetical protein
VYSEKDILRVVRVAQVATNEWGVRFIFKAVSAPGFEGEGRRGWFRATAAWEVLGMSDRSVSASWIRWRLVIRPDLVNRITSAAAEGKSGRELADYINTCLRADLDKDVNDDTR